MVWAAVVWSSEGKSPSSRHGQNLQSQRGLAFGLGPLFLGGEIRNLPGEVLHEYRGERLTENGRGDRRREATRLCERRRHCLAPLRGGPGGGGRWLACCRVGRSRRYGSA